MTDLFIGYMTQRFPKGSPPMYYYGIHGVKNRETMDPDYIGSGPGIVAAIKKHGKSVFHRTVLREFDNREDANAWESRVVTVREIEDPLCYNRNLGGSFGGLQSKATIARISKKLKNRPMAEETKIKIRAKLKGVPRPKDVREKISASRAGKVCPEDVKKKISGKLTGRKLPDTHKANISKGGMGRKASPETGAKISAAKKGVKHTAEARAKMSASHKGVKLSEKHKAGMRAAWAKKRRQREEETE